MIDFLDIVPGVTPRVFVGLTMLGFFTACPNRFFGAYYKRFLLSWHWAYV